MIETVTPYLAANGYYIVNQQAFANKLMAVIEGTRCNQHPRWYFNDAEFDSVDWTVEPPESLTELYQKRAREIRQKHDYVILMFSGGIDSTTVLRAFLDQGLHIDEIVTTWPVAAAEIYSGSYQDRSPENYIAEWVYCLKPRLDRVAQSCPRTKITVVDSTVDICRDVYTEQDFFLFDSFQNLPGMNRWSVFIKEIKKIAETHQNHCVLLGLDKPHFRVDGRNFNLYFIDVSLFVKSSADLNIEYFYWHPDATDILKKQSHTIFRHFNQHPGDIAKLNQRDDDLLASINTLIYPHYDHRIFQARKQTYLLYNDQQKWAWNLSQYQDGSYVDRWQSYWRNFLLAIDPKYIRYKNNLFDGLIGFVTKDYHIAQFSHSTRS